MKVTVEKITGEEAMREAFSETAGGREIKASTARLYASMHSPIRTQLFKVTMKGIYSFVSVHLTRHKIGVEHFVSTRREDRWSATTPGCSGEYGGLTPEFFREVFRYEDGKLFWKGKISARSRYTEGEEAGGKNVHGRWTVSIGTKRLYRSVIVFMMHEGFRPPVVDHIDRDGTNDRIGNLRAATPTENARNSHYDNMHGFKGVRKERNNRFSAIIMIGGKQTYLGSFPTIDEAALTYDAAAIKYFGEFSHLNFPDPDRKITRGELINHSMLINAQALVNLSHKRLCGKASPETREVMKLIKEGVALVDPDLAPLMVPLCVYRNGLCNELPKPCGFNLTIRPEGQGPEQIIEL